MDLVTLVGRETPARCGGSWRVGEPVKLGSEDYAECCHVLVDVSGVSTVPEFRRAPWFAERKTFPEAISRGVADMGPCPSRAFGLLMADDVIAYRAGLCGADGRRGAAFVG